MSQVDKKIEFIKKWYRDECLNLEFKYKLKLARVWINVCLKNEEYEMATAIIEEKEKMIKNHIKNKRRKRGFLQKLMIYVFLFKRKVNAYIKNKK